jgi:hypothetical protein
MGIPEMVMGKILRMATPMTPVVLHFRDAVTDDMGHEPLSNCLTLLEQVRVPLWV